MTFVFIMVGVVLAAGIARFLIYCMDLADSKKEKKKEDLCTDLGIISIVRLGSKYRIKKVCGDTTFWLHRKNPELEDKNRWFQYVLNEYLDFDTLEEAEKAFEICQKPGKLYTETIKSVDQRTNLTSDDLIVKKSLIDQLNEAIEKGDHKTEDEILKAMGVKIDSKPKRSPIGYSGSYGTGPK